MQHTLKYASKDDGMERYEAAEKAAKSGLAIAMDGLESGEAALIKEGIAQAWEGVKEICAISKEMKGEFGERRGGYRDGYRGGYARGGYRGNYRDIEWGERDDEMMERRMRDSRGRFM